MARARRYRDMLAIYTITPRADLTAFDIAVVASDGSRHTLLGFTTMAEAEAWIEEDKRRDRRPATTAVAPPRGRPSPALGASGGYPRSG